MTPSSAEIEQRLNNIMDEINEIKGLLSQRMQYNETLTEQRFYGSQSPLQRTGRQDSRFTRAGDNAPKGLGSPYRSQASR